MSSIEHINYDLVFRHHNLAQLITDSRGKIIHINDKFTDITGYCLEEIQDKTLETLFCKLDKKRLFMFHNKKNTLGSKTFSHEITIVAKDNQKKEVKIWFNIYKEESYRVCSIEDAAEKTQLLHQVHEENKKLETILTHLGDGVIVCDSEGKITIINKRAMLLLDLRTSHGVVMSRDAILGQNIELCFPQFHREIQESMREFARNSEVSCKFVLENKGFVIQVVYSPIFTAEEKLIGTAFLLHDISKEIEAERFRMEAIRKEVEIAKKIQTTLLPPENVLIHAKDHFAISAKMIPSDEVGGDYYDFIPSKNERFWFTIGDVSGHGLTSGLIMMMAQVAIMTTTILAPEISPQEMYAKINHVLYTNIRERMKQNHYMTLSLLVSNTQGEFYYVGAHLDLIIYRSEQQQCERIRTEGIWLGILPDITHATYEKSFHLNRSDVLILITDGIIEVQNHDGEIYDFERLIHLIENNAQLSVENLRNCILEDISNYTSNPDDDMSLVVIRKI